MNETTLAAQQQCMAAPVPPAGERLAVDAAVRRIVLAWAMEELASLRMDRPARADAKERFLALNATSRTIHLYGVSAGSVELLEKPADVETDPTGRRRSQAYLKFFRDVCRFLPESPPFYLALETSDKVVEKVDVPVFAFQKRRGEASILLPDIDFLNHDFYAAPRYNDPRAYRSKQAKAIFVGSTSGGQVTPEVARNCTLPRLRSARHFTGNPRVDFLLPQIVQTTNEEAAEILRQMPFCQSAYMSFQDQLQRRFVISMDGNGATCSRVVIALKSNSVLLKYDSDDLLYYFRHLQPWLHYVPVTRDADIDTILDMERSAPEFFESIAEGGRQFAATYLSRDGVFAYMIELLKVYAGCFLGAGGAPEPLAQVTAEPASPPPGVVFVAHMQGRGDVAAGREGWIGDAQDVRGIEGFTFSLGDAALDRHVFYRSLAGDGTQSGLIPAGAYCGTRGQARPIHGFVINCTTSGAHMPPLQYQGIFSDGFSSGRLAPGGLCRSPRGAALVAMRIGLANG